VEEYNARDKQGDTEFEDLNICSYRLTVAGIKGGIFSLWPINAQMHHHCIPYKLLRKCDYYCNIFI